MEIENDLFMVGDKVRLRPKKEIERFISVSNKKLGKCLTYLVWCSGLRQSEVYTVNRLSENLHHSPSSALEFREVDGDFPDCFFSLCDKEGNVIDEGRPVPKRSYKPRKKKEAITLESILKENSIGEYDYFREDQD